MRYNSDQSSWISKGQRQAGGGIDLNVSFDGIGMAIYCEQDL
jgi:hypothetical protein